MNEPKEQKGRFFQMPSALLIALSDTALRILAYAIDKQGLVNLGYLAKYELTPTDVSSMFGKFKGYSFNTVQKGFRELKEMRLITYHENNHYVLNTAELETWYKKGDTQNLGTLGDTQNLGTLPPSHGGDTQKLGKGDTQNLGTNKREYKREKNKEESTVQELNNQRSVRGTLESSSASIQEAKPLPSVQVSSSLHSSTASGNGLSFFDEVFPEVTSSTVLGERIACGESITSGGAGVTSQFDWSEIEQDARKIPSAVLTLPKKKNAPSAPPAFANGIRGHESECPKCFALNTFFVPTHIVGSGFKVNCGECNKVYAI